MIRFPSHGNVNPSAVNITLRYRHRPGVDDLDLICFSLGQIEFEQRRLRGAGVNELVIVLFPGAGYLTHNSWLWIQSFHGARFEDLAQEGKTRRAFTIVLLTVM